MSSSYAKKFNIRIFPRGEFFQDIKPQNARKKMPSDREK